MFDITSSMVLWGFGWVGVATTITLAYLDSFTSLDGVAQFMSFVGSWRVSGGAVGGQ